jgi:hypothetical protein
MRVPVGRVRDAKYLLLKMPVITLMKKKNETNPKRQKLGLTKYKKLTMS